MPQRQQPRWTRLQFVKALESLRQLANDTGMARILGHQYQYSLPRRVEQEVQMIVPPRRPAIGFMSTDEGRQWAPVPPRSLRKTHHRAPQSGGDVATGRTSLEPRHGGTQARSQAGLSAHLASRTIAHAQARSRSKRRIIEKSSAMHALVVAPSLDSIDRGQQTRKNRRSIDAPARRYERDLH